MFGSIKDQGAVRLVNGHATVPRRGTLAARGRRLTAPACAIAVALLLAGNVAAVQLERDDRGNAALVTPRLDPLTGWSPGPGYKLATTAGYKALVFG